MTSTATLAGPLTDAQQLIDGRWWVSPWPGTTLGLVTVAAAFALLRWPRTRTPLLACAGLAALTWHGPMSLAVGLWMLAAGWIGLQRSVAGKPGRGLAIAAVFVPVGADNVLQGCGITAVAGVGLQAVGASYLALQVVGHVLDARTGSAPRATFGQFAAAHTLFFKAIAGPIARAKHVITTAPTTPADIAAGVQRALYGVLLKFVLADNLWPAVARIDPSSGAAGAWLWAAGYTVHLYLDFAGCTHIAIGSGRALGYTLPENFARPFTAPSVAEFWRRWHMSLSFWLRDYLFNRIARRKWLAPGRQMLLASFLTMVVCGAWHGLQAGFLLWGALHGAVLVIERLWVQRKAPIAPKPVRVAATWAFLALAFVPFGLPAAQWRPALLAAVGTRGAGAVEASAMAGLAAMVAVVLIDHAGHWFVERQPALQRALPLELSTAFGVASVALYYLYGFSGAEFIYGAF
jgi:alginate O-acetyltransferase complex protein AlgI